MMAKDGEGADEVDDKKRGDEDDGNSITFL